MTPFGNFIIELPPIAGIRGAYNHHGSCSLTVDYRLLKKCMSVALYGPELTVNSACLNTWLVSIQPTLYV